MKIFLRMICLGLTMGLGLGVSAQSSQVITLRITEEGRDAAPLVDTTFRVEKLVDVDALLAEIKSSRLLTNRSGLSTVLIIRELDQEADETDQRPERSGPRPMLGVYLDDGNHQKQGVLVTKIISRSGAEAAGLQADDVILSVDGKTTSSSHDIAEAKSTFSVGDEVEVTFSRQGGTQTVKVELRAPQEETKIKVHTQATSSRGFMGVYPDEVSANRAKELGLSSQQGVYLNGVVRSSGAAKAGLLEGDVITAIEGRGLDAAYELSDALRGHVPGDTIAVDYWRDGQTQQTQVILTERVTPAPQQRKRVHVERAFLGVTLDDSPRTSEPAGVRITHITEGQAAEAAGLKANDRILSIAGKETPNYDALVKVMRTLEPTQRVTIDYLRKGKNASTKATLGSHLLYMWVNLPEAAGLPVEALVKDIEDQKQASQIRQFMESPSLDMDRFELFPNPNDGRFTLRFSMADEEDTDVRIFSSTGQELFRDRLRNFSGDYDRSIDLRETVSEGVYFLQVTRNGKGMVERLLINQ
jgi:S1-C subfamily serine protease